MSEIGKNTLGAEQLRGFVERIEKEQADIQSHKDSIGIIMAEAKAANLVPAGIKYVLKRRKEKPSEIAEKDALRDMYMHAMGMAVETPLFRAVGLMASDVMTKESVIEAMKRFVPQNGSIVVEAGGAPVRLTRDSDGNVSVTEVVEQPVRTGEGQSRTSTVRAPVVDVPDVDGDGAEALGADAFKKDNPIITNPFPFGDGRRARWDRGWRKASGGDGMGPEEQAPMDEYFTKFGEVLRPSEAEEPILAKPMRSALIAWLSEVWAEKELEAVGLKARRRALFSGPAGTGKTTLAHHLAARLGLRMAIIRPDDIHGRFIGTGTANVKRIFDAAEEVQEKSGEPLVLFFDEFDTLAQKRMHGGANPTVEHDHNAMVNALLARLDAYKAFIIAATNTASAVDPSVWRRFEIHVAVDLPGQFEREKIVERYLAPFGLPADALYRLAEALETATPALIRSLCEGIKRQIVIGPHCDWDMRKEAVVERLLESVLPHPDAGKPRLWTLGVKDQAVRELPWPLPKLSELDCVAPSPVRAADNVVAFGGGRA